MKTDIEIDRNLNLKQITEIASEFKIPQESVEMYGAHKAKLSLDLLKNKPQGKLILMTSVHPTPQGEGKTTMNIGLSMALNKLGKKAISCLREPSLGPCFGMKGGATGGGQAQIHPMSDINLHFTGDFHAITSAHNLLAAMVDNHIYHGNELNLDPNRILWNRVMDMNDRELRTIETKTRTSRFDITAASEIMAILCLSENYDDLKLRLGKIVVGYTFDDQEITAKDVDAVGAMTLLLKDALKPNLVQTTQHTPAIVHGGPFANIAHGCNSVIATKMSMGLADYTITEAGFGADLGAEKFFDIKCRAANLKPDAVVLVVTIRSLKYQGGMKLEDLHKEDFSSLYKGLEHLEKHLCNLMNFGIPVVVGVNGFKEDTEKERAVLRNFANENHNKIAFTNVFDEGGGSAVDLAKLVIEEASQPSKLRFLYEDTEDIQTSIAKVTKNLYGAKDVIYTKEALSDLKQIKNQRLPICIAKTQYSFSDDPNDRNVPSNFVVKVKSIRLSQGAGFVVVLLGDIMTMPGLSKKPNAIKMDYFDDGTVVGLS